MLRTCIVLITFLLLGSENISYAQAAFSPMRVTPLPQPLQMHGSAVIGQRLYIFGGSHDTTWSNKVLSAPIQPGGTLGTWREETPLPEYRHYLGQSIEVMNDIVYIIGGSYMTTVDAKETDVKFANDVIYARAGADGKLSDWKRSARFPTNKLSNAACGSTDKFLYVVGGATGRNPYDDVLFSPVSETGDLSAWQSAGKLPTPLWFHGAAVLDNRLYVWGGLTGGGNETASPNVYYTELLPDGKIGEWRRTKPMPEAVYSSAFCGFNDYLVCIAGRYRGALPTNDIWYAHLQNGEVTTWQKITTDLDTRLYTALGLDKTNGFIFINGGRFRTQAGGTGPTHLVAEVAAFKLTANPGKPKQQTNVVSALPALDRALSATGPKPVLAYFHSPEVPGCKRFEDSVLTARLESLKSQFTLAAVDSSKDAKTTSRYNVFRVPCLAVIAPDGKLRKASLRLQTSTDLDEFLKKL